MKQLPDVPAGDVLVDGLGVGDVGSIVLRDRKHLSEDGLIVAVCSIDAQSGKVVSGPDIVSRGFVYVRESEALMDEARDLVYNTLEECAREHVRDWSGMKQRIKDEALPLFVPEDPPQPHDSPHHHGGVKAGRASLGRRGCEAA